MKVVIIHLDGLGFEYLKKSNLSFIKNLKGNLYRMQIFPGYFVNEVSLFTGLTPNQHNMEDIFILNESLSPFKNPLSLLIPKKLYRFFAYFYGYETYISINPPKRHFQKFVPISKISPRFFEDSFPSLLNEHNLKFEYVSSLHFNLNNIKTAIKENDCVYATNLTYDHILHEHGAFHQAKTDIDNFVKNLHKFLNEKYKDDFCIILLSDHGMVDVHSQIYLDKSLNEDSLTFVDSTILRIWSNKEITFNNINAELIDTKQLNGKYKYYKKFVANPGYIFSPNFFQGTNFIKGMHGYKSTNSPHDAFLIIHNPKAKKHYITSCSIIDVAPTILNMFKIDKLSTMTGRVL